MSAAPRPTRNGLKLAGGLFAVALGLRCGWVLWSWLQHGPALEFDDERLHWALAQNLVHDGVLVSDDGRLAARMPVYPLFLALFAGLGDSGILVARLVQALLGAVTVVVAYAFARSACGGRAAVLAGLLVGFDPFAVFFANLLLTEVAFTLIAVALIACAWQTACTARARDADASAARGPLIGVAVLGPLALLTRPSAAALLPLLWLALWLADADRRRGAARVLVYAAALALFLLPWGLRNHAVLDAYAWLSANGGVTLYDALGPQADGSSDQSFLHHMPELEGLGEIERDRLLRRRARAYAFEHPRHVAELAWIKFQRTWNPFPNFAEYRGGWTGVVSAVYTTALLVLAGAGLIATLVRRAGRHVGLYQVLVWLPVVYFTLLHCIFIGSLRYRVPLMPLLALAAAGVATAAAARPRPRTR